LVRQLSVFQRVVAQLPFPELQLVATAETAKVLVLAVMAHLSVWLATAVRMMRLAELRAAHLTSRKPPLPVMLVLPAEVPARPGLQAVR
jgi:hypothetical protein